MGRLLGSCLLLLACGVLRVAAGGAAPTFDNIATDGSTRVSISESAGTGSSVFQVQATDPEGDTITYSLVSPPANFKITGQEIQVDTALDFETTQNYVLQVQIVDGTNTVTADLNVDVTDVNDETPTLSGGTTAAFNEEQAAGTTVSFGFTVTDTDAGDTLTYSLTGAHAAYFNVDSTGVITTSQVLDYDITSPITTYSITLNVLDAASHSLATPLTVTLNDINDNTPICTPNIYYRDVTENTASGTSVATIACTDADSTPNSDITLSIVNGDDATPKFSVSGTDVVTSATAIDYETVTSYTLVLHAVDGGTVKRTGTATLIVTVLSQNEAAPAWLAFTPAYGGSGSPYSILENVAIGTTIATAAASDADNGIDGVVNGDGEDHGGDFDYDSGDGEDHGVDVDYDSGDGEDHGGDFDYDSGDGEDHGVDVDYDSGDGEDHGVDFDYDSGDGEDHGVDVDYDSGDGEDHGVDVDYDSGNGEDHGGDFDYDSGDGEDHGVDVDYDSGDGEDHGGDFDYDSGDGEDHGVDVDYDSGDGEDHGGDFDYDSGDGEDHGVDMVAAR
ncbi:protocadherin alpha-13-like [Gigantopelta aegis]|uniref:protocadherin alpha-13-like n=1 Tax=Gigantopelta aegis TaxID=1735272 RepID=UPI001B88C7C0|nr:protocadherin alpha-13-like [Gigantopelta aegis]